MADAALVTEDNLVALRDTLCITRLPATYGEWGRVIAEAVARNQWTEIGILAQTQPTKHRPGTSYKVAEDVVTLYGKTYRAIVVHSSSQDQRRHKRLEREGPESYATLEAIVRDLATHTYFCRAAAAGAAQPLRALASASHPGEVAVAAGPQYGPGRPSRPQPRPITALS